MSQVKKEDIDSKDEFERRLQALGHFPSVYKTIDELKYLFKMQLEKVLPGL